METRRTLHDRLTTEFGDADFAGAVVGRLGDDTIAAIDTFCDGAMMTSPNLSYQPVRLAADQIDAVIAFSYGYRLIPGSSPRVGDIPPQDELSPGPINELLAGATAMHVAVHPVPVIAQWEIARVLVDIDIDIDGVVSVEPDVGNDGVTTYLSTAGVVDKGLALAAAAGLQPRSIGVVAHTDHAPRCVATVRARGLAAGIVAGLSLPDAYDPESGQRWTRDRITWIATDLFARTRLADSTDWNPPT